ncbi:hypothetical protein EGW08_012945 [Elysia chlorotica]|uniref:Major facilitator superfamily (MFS) profile domain-containing protein n=1 Tax=Elysia chlorotica TaxID=188477 RepID=A0A433TCP7_ELYCH|nr:hypothetical protein EGW08_012945 [Elysia chlorotica]
MADSMEIMLLSILGPVLSCEWYLPPWKQALLTTLVMTGMMLGSTYWGFITDKYGRKTVFWAVGAAVEVIMAMLVMPTLGWRYLMAFSALPVLLFPIFSHLVSRGQMKDMFTPSYRLLSCVLNCLWFLFGLLYYGLALLLPTLLNNPDGCHGNDITREDKESCTVECTAFTQSDYVDLVATAFADMPGLAIAYLLLQVMGRKASISLTSLACAIFLMISNFCMSRKYLTATLFVARAMIAGGYQVIFIYTTECYPTNIRAIGMGFLSGASKLGAVLTPFIAQVLTDYSAFASFTSYAVAALLCSVFALVLPFDTRGRAMTDVPH